MTNKQLIFALIALGIVIFITELIFQARTQGKRKFTWRRYWFFAMFPILMSMLMIYGLGSRYAIIFVVSIFFGTLFEWLIGFYYHRITGEKLWRYKRNNITEYVSVLTLPAWGFAGLLFVFLGRLILG